MNFVTSNMAKNATKVAFAKPALFTFFAGAGFLDLGFETSGFEVVFVNEFHKAILGSYKYARLKMGISKPVFGYLQDDITALLSDKEASSLSHYVGRARRSHGLVGFVGGPPCPDFSVAGKNKGRDGKNGNLSQVYVDLICIQKPDFFVFENVKGLWRTKTHRIFYDELKQKLSDVGYVLTDRLINSIEYGAPQDRDRIILVGLLKEKFGGLSDETPSNFPWKENMPFDRSELQNKNWPQAEKFTLSKLKPAPNGIHASLTVQHWFNKNRVTTHPNANDCFVPRAALPKFQTIDEGDDSKKCFKRLHRWRYSPTAAYGNNEVHLHPFEARRISVAEALALQSLPKSFTMPPEMTLTDKFKAIGNGVPFEAAKGIAKSVRKYLELVS